MRLRFRLLWSLAFSTQSFGASPRGPSRIVRGFALSIPWLFDHHFFAEPLSNGDELLVSRLSGKDGDLAQGGL